jgi:hypothetical protein
VDAGEVRGVRAKDVFIQNNGDVTKAYYAELNALGLDGQLAVALFRAQKRSTAAKKYRGRQYRGAAYEVKNWSLGEICRIAALLNHRWGWKHDPNTPGYSQVLYVDLPTGQASFHSADRLSGPDYPGDWDGQRGVCEDRICEFCDMVSNFCRPEAIVEAGTAMDGAQRHPVAKLLNLAP